MTLFDALSEFATDRPGAAVEAGIVLALPARHEPLPGPIERVQPRLGAAA